VHPGNTPGATTDPPAPDRPTTTTHEVKVPAPGCQRFGIRHRLPDEAAYSRAFAGASRSRDRLFTVLSCRNESDRARLGLAISKKHCRRATARNRLKRIARESFRQHLEILAGLDVVVLAQSGTADASNQALFDSLLKHWHKTRSAHFDGDPAAHNGRRP
jgi:ribonuclease P protein component